MARFRFNKGFSLLEVLLAMAIMSIGVLTVVSLISLNLRGLNAARATLSEIAAVQKQIEEVRNDRDNGQALAWDAEGKYQVIASSGNTTIIYHLYNWR